LRECWESAESLRRAERVLKELGAEKEPRELGAERT
jgi:hypothetical protein